ncbi:hypothetical protein [Caldisalinibacter kiritimatiensis]|uniref:Uncharacterized protein n=1 Tax=Caldisalinibacter kiritimatiensis TaxID=1304284 RepID=R1ASW6_9FIRM|nr:hypothetical protein [Caldisalinibacter kiritimatiensis]EOD00243.1 hypothetical protein L21TH_1717 [Caldisalinibacter kiritimatiensis]
MEFIEVSSIVIIVLGCIMVLGQIMITIATQARIEWKLIRLVVAVFMGLSVWAVYRFLNRYPDINVYDILILVFNVGLFLVGHAATKKVK